MSSLFIKNFSYFFLVKPPIRFNNIFKLLFLNVLGNSLFIFVFGVNVKSFFNSDYSLYD